MADDRFPFDCIIVTSPDAASAKSAEGPLNSVLQKRLRQRYPSQTVKIVSTYDPFGARCGSGGGTLAALEYANPKDTVLVLHAGGDSSRCPTQMIMGKAWTSIPSSHYRNPTIWLIDQIQRLYEQAHFPKGTCVVAATDCLATFFERRDLGKVDWVYEYKDESVVLGVAVPAPVTTAKNHGVFIMSDGIANNTYKLGIEDPHEVWQKPTVQELVDTTDPAPASFTIWRHKEKQAWIDTGIVVFLPKAVDTLYELANGILARCTRKGLEEAYEKSSKSETLDTFAKMNALKIDLYTDILHNLAWPTQKKEKTTSPLRKVLSKLPLQVLIAPQGRFLHLGTTQELADFITSGAFPDDINDRNNTIAALARYFSLQPRYRCWTDPLPFAHNVVLQSTFPHDSTLGTRSFTEYSDLISYEKVIIGENTMLSGWRNPTNDKSILRIPSNLGVQLLSLRNDSDVPDQFAYMVFGMKDGIKEPRKTGTIYGVPVQDFLLKTGVTLEELGWKDGNESSDSIWTAKINPKVSVGTTFESVFGWLFDLLESKDTSIVTHPSLQKWISSPRVSLKDLHSLADAEIEWNFRQSLEDRVLRLEREEFIPHMRRLLKERVHDHPCDLQWLVEMEDREAAKAELFKIIPALEEIVREEIALKKYDICGRAFMIASALLADFEAASSHLQDEALVAQISEYCSPHIARLRSNSTRAISIEEQLVALNAITSKREETMELRCLSVFSNIMERLAFCMNEWSIAMGFHAFLDSSGKKVTESRNSPVVIGKWVMAACPARADLAGAWSDTPPVCYEYGGSVTGMAILVDDHMPLSCRCRIVPGKTGVLLRTEGRDSFDGKLKYHLDAEIENASDMSDFRDPLSDCALVKSALVCLGMISEEQIRSGVEIQPLINKFCSSTENVRIEVVTASLLPHGSGLGTSSILGGCILASIAECVGIGKLDDDYLLHAVLMLEQLLSSGGGYQDQAHGIAPGIKTVRSKPAELPVAMSVETLKLEPEFFDLFQKRMILVFTGKTRLAKNILQSVLRRWARRTDEVVCGIERIVKLAEQARTAFIESDLESLGDALYECSKMKVVMTGEDSGSIPPAVEKVVADLMDRDVIKGASLCGAGGGGFMMMLASEGYNRLQVEEFVNKELLKDNPDLADFTWHDCRVCQKGLTTYVIDEPGVDLESFKLSWQHVKE